MKKQNILILSLAAVAGMVLTGCNLTPDVSDKDEIPDTSVIDDAVETADEVGTKVSLHSAVTPTAQVNVSSAFGYEILDKTASTMSVRIIAVVDDYKNLTSASVTSKVVSSRTDKNTAGEDETIIKEEKTFNVTEVYSSLSDTSSIGWNGTIEESFAKKYYIIYTLRNVPVAHYYDTIIVKFSATSLAEDSKEFIVNANGVAGWDSRFTATPISDTDSDYSLTASYNNGDDLYVPSDYYSVSDCYAVKVGTITTIEAKAFGRTINKLTLPNTITTIKAGAFNYVAVAEMNVPSSLVSIASGAFKGSYEVGKLIYETPNLVNANDTGFCATNIVISKNVKSIPNKFFSSSSKPESIVFEGTEAEWEAMKSEDNASSGFYYLDVVCADTTYSTVTFHYGSGKLGDVTGDVEVRARNNRTVADPGNPYLAEKEFKGWYTDEAGANAFDFNSLVTTDLDLYAVYGEPGAGYSFANPLEMSPSSASSFSASLYPGKEFEYIKFTVPETASGSDWYYFSVDEDNSVKDSTISTSSSSVDGAITVYSVSDTENPLSTESSWTVKSGKVVQYGASDSGSVRIYAAPGETYYIKASMTRAYYSNQNQYNYGTIAMKFFTFANDSASEAIAMSKGVSVTPNFISSSQPLLYKYVAETSETVIFKKDDKAYNYTNIVVVDASAPTTEIAASSGTGSSSFGFDVESGHTYYVEIKANYATSDVAADKYFSFSIEDAPEGYSKDKALSYTLGETKTVTQIYTSSDKYLAGAYYTFAASEDGLYGVTTGAGSSSYGQTVIIYDESGNPVSGATLKSASKGKTLDASEVTLNEGTYTVFVGYDGSISGSSSGWGDYDSKTKITSWKDFTFSIVKIAVGDSINLPEDITPTLGENTTLVGSTKGKFYRIASTADNYLIIDVSSVSSKTTIALLDTTGKSLKTASNGKIVYKTTSGVSYIVKVSGQDASETVKFSRADTVETGETADTAYSLNLGSDGLADLTSYAPASSYSTLFFKYTATSTGTFKLFFQATKDGSAATGNGPDSAISDVYDSSTSSTALTAIVNNDDDKSAHAETLGVPYSAYAEYAFTSGTTYYLKLKVPTVGSTADTIKFGIKEKTTGSSADVADSGATINDGDTSVSVDGTSDGYWSKITFAVSKKFTFTLPDENTTVKIYSSTDTTTPIVTLSGTEASDALIFASGDYLFCCQINGVSEKTSVSVAVAQEDLPDYYTTTTSGTGSYSDRTSTPTGVDDTKGWSEMSDHAGVYQSGKCDSSYGKSALIYHFTKAGTFSFEWTFSGESNCRYDYLYITHTSGTSTSVVVNGSTEGDAGVTSFDNLTWHTAEPITVAAGDIITFLYTKDSGTSGTLDAAYIRNVTFTVA